MSDNEDDSVFTMLEALRLTLTSWLAKLEARIDQLEKRIERLERGDEAR
jgi:cell division protein FtsB